MSDDIPTYEVIANRFNPKPLGIFNCPCGGRHKHGLPDKGIPEHRTAHCNDESHPKGYYIIWNGKEDGVKPDKKRR